MLENKCSGEAKDDAHRDRDNSKKYKLSRNNEYCVPLECRVLEGVNCVEQDDRYNIIKHSFSKDTRVKLRLLMVVDDRDSSDHITGA